MLLVTYDLHKPERDYADVIDTIRAFGEAYEVQESVWMLDTEHGVDVCRDAICDVTDLEATVLVIETIPEWAAYQTVGANKWMQSVQRSWS